MKTTLKEGQNDTLKGPPLGIIPKYIHDEQRFKEIRDAIKRYVDGYQYIDSVWISEYNELLEQISKKK